MDFSGVTEVMSNAYATRFKILPVEVTPRDVVIATAEPFVREWEKELRPILRKDIRRVIANPQVIERYIVESCAEYVRLRSRMTMSDRTIQSRALDLQEEGTPVRVSRFLGIE